MYKTISKLLPKNIKKDFKKRLSYSSIDLDIDKFLGFLVFATLSFGFIVGQIGSGLFGVSFFILGPASALMIPVLVYVWLMLSADSKKKFVENVLPDALQLMSSNIRAGITVDKAFILAARPEFGPLEAEIRRVGKETMAGRDLVDSLRGMTVRINSTNLDRSIDLIIHSIRSGGQLADLLDQTANDLRDQQIVQKEISASVLMYVLFVFIAIGLGAPMLFSMSAFLVNLLSEMSTNIAAGMPEGEAIQGAPISMGSSDIDPGFIRNFALLSMAVSSIFGGIVMGLIMGGEEKSGLKFIPLLVVISISLFFIGTFLLEKILGGMMEM